MQLKNIKQQKQSSSSKTLPRQYQSEGNLEAIPENGPATHIMKKQAREKSATKPLVSAAMHITGAETPVMNVLVESPYSKAAAAASKAKLQKMLGRA